MASGTDGNIISYDASGNPVAIATGNDGEVLTSAGAGQPPAFEAVSGGAALTGSTNNQVTTVTGADAIQGETNFIYDGTIVGAGADGANADLGAGIHIKISDTGADVHSSADELIIERSADNGMTFLTSVTGESFINFGDSGDNDIGQIRYHHAYNRMQFHTNATERVRIGPGGQFAISNSDTFASTYTLDMQFTGTGARMNRADDGTILLFQSAGSNEGYVSISGSTCTYYTFTGGHWGQLSDNSNPTILRGTVMETIDEMCDWYVLEFLNKECKTTKEQHLLQEGQSAGDVINHTYEGEPVEATIVKEENNNLAKVKISDSEDSKAVYGVFQTWDDDNDMNVVALGTFVVRIHSGETVAIGDLLSSKGDGTAKVQADDIMRARTIAKVTSTIKQTTYADDSYTVPCTLHCG